MNLFRINSALKEAVGKRKTKAKPKYRGKTISFAELDGPFTKGPGGRGDFEQGEYSITYYDSQDNEIHSMGYKSYRQAQAALDKLAKAGVEIGSLSGG